MDWFIRDISLYCYRSSSLGLRLSACVALRRIPSTHMLFHLKVFPDSYSSQAKYPLIIMFPARVLMKGAGACSVMDVSDPKVSASLLLVLPLLLPHFPSESVVDVEDAIHVPPSLT